MSARPYDNPIWKPLRQSILQRDNHTCRIQLEGCTTHADRVDHITGWKQGGAWYDPANLQAACRSCNITKRYQGDTPTTPEPRYSHTW